MYQDLMVLPMREDLTRLGVEELRTQEEVDKVLKEHQGTTFLVINSVCGCAAGNARPAVRLAQQNDKLPDNFKTVFAGQDKEATARARTYISEHPPSSPSFALFKEGRLVTFIPRHRIEGRTPEEIADDITQAFDEFC